ncbi:MAG: ABC transporter permease, partial [candidate division WOR-3 bacterium]|nr:ABC transporter permease [candidate division WOR-3 bacterium]
TITGRCVSAMAAEIGTMKITEQIDALRAFKIDPLNYLVKPRLIAMFVTLPLLNGFMILVSLLVGAVYAQMFYHTNIDIFFYGLTHPFHTKDFWISFIKSGFFAFWISTAGTYSGFSVSGGAKEVGQAATKAVVISTILILILDFIAALIFI